MTSTVVGAGSFPAIGVVSWMSFEKHDRVNGRASASRVVGLDEIADKGEVEGAFQVAIEMILRYQLFERYIDHRSKRPYFRPQHPAAHFC
jgi:hypothetical protein